MEGVNVRGLKFFNGWSVLCKCALCSFLSYSFKQSSIPFLLLWSLIYSCCPFTMTDHLGIRLLWATSCVSFMGTQGLASFPEPYISLPPHCCNISYSSHGEINSLTGPCPQLVWRQVCKAKGLMGASGLGFCLSDHSGGTMANRLYVCGVVGWKTIWLVGMRFVQNSSQA